MTDNLLDHERLPPKIEERLREGNPWWEGKPGRIIPPYRRWAFHTTLRKMDSHLAPVTVLRGPRQVGKTTLQEQLIDFLMKERGVEPSHILRVQFDEIPSLQNMKEPVLALARWFQIWVLRMTFNEAAHKSQPAYLFFDEVQNINSWAPQIKHLVDTHTLNAFVTGSSALRIEAGRDSLAGRIAPVDLGTLLLREIAGLRFSNELKPYLPDNGLEPLLRADFWRGLHEYGLLHRTQRDKAFAAFSERGGYPMAQANAGAPWPEVADQLNETVIKRAIQHDLRMGKRGMRRDAQLLEEVYRLACRYAGQCPGQSVFVPEVRQALGANIGWQRILEYLKFLDGALLLRLVHPLELRLKKKKGASKLCLCDHGLRASWLQEVIPLDKQNLMDSPHLHDLAGHLVESVIGYFLGGLPHLDLAHFPARGIEPEVDFVLSIGEKRIPLEVKYRWKIDPHEDTRGLRSFLEKTVYNAPFGVLITMDDNVPIPDPRIIPVSLPSLLLMR